MGAQNLHTDFEKIKRGSSMINSLCIYTNLKEDMGNNYRYTALYGYLAVGVIDQDGNICFYSGTKDSTTGLDFTKYTTTLIKLQSDVITKICVTDIPPNNDTELDLYLNQPYIKTTVNEFSNADFSVEFQNNGLSKWLRLQRKRFAL